MRKIKSTRISPMSGELSIAPFKSETPSYDPEPESTKEAIPNTTIVPNKCSPIHCEYGTGSTNTDNNDGTFRTRPVEYSVYVENAEPAGMLLLQVISEHIVYKKSTIFSLGGEITPLSILINGEYVGDVDERDLIDIGELSPGDILQVVATGSISSPTTILLEFETMRK